MSNSNRLLPPRDAKALADYESGAWVRFLDLTYASDSPSQTLDLWLPERGERPAPVVFHLHGGAFDRGEKFGFGSVPVLHMLTRGWAVADVEYRKSGEAVFPAMLEDAAAAVRFLRERAGLYGLDPDFFAAWGASSGAWLVSMLGVTAGNPAFTAPAIGDECRVQAVVDWCGPCGNFALMDADFAQSGLGERTHNAPDSPESRFMGGTVTDIPEACRLSAPGTWAFSGAPEFLVLHGALDDTVPVQQSERFCDSLLQAGCRVEKHILDGLYHHSPEWNGNAVIRSLTEDFLDRAYKAYSSGAPA